MSNHRTVSLVFDDRKTALTFFQWWVNTGCNEFHRGHFEITARPPSQPTVKLGELRSP